MAQSAYTEFGFFGGAIRAEIPTTYRDMSDIVPIPDNQEVFSDQASKATFMVEILERQDISDETAGAFFFQELAEYNEADSDEFNTLYSVVSAEAPQVQTAGGKFMVEGEQWIKPNKNPDVARDHVKIVMSVIRLPEVTSDIVSSINVPIQEGETPFEAARSHMQKFLATFTIANYSLFVN